MSETLRRDSEALLQFTHEFVSRGLQRRSLAGEDELLSDHNLAEKAVQELKDGNLLPRRWIGTRNSRELTLDCYEQMTKSRRS